MHKVSKDRRGRLARAALVAVGGVSTLMVAGHVSAAVINVAAANFATTTANNDATAFGANNHAITPVNYAVPTVTIPLGSHPSDAADPDTGTQWNSLQAVSTNLAANTTAVTYIQYEKNLALVDSQGNATGVTLNVYNRLPSNKGTADGIHLGSNIPLGAGTDGLSPTPIGSSGPGGTLDGYSASANNNELMGSEWVSNGTSNGFGFTFSGLVPNTAYSLYVYGAGSNSNTTSANGIGQGGRFEGTSTIVTDINGNTTGGALNATNVTTNNDPAASHRSVFDASNSAASEQGLSWNLLSLTSDANGQLSFAEDSKSPLGGIKPALNGFQLDGPLPTPEPTSALLFGIGSIGFMLKRRSRT